jgi:hypothetical protein
VSDHPPRESLVDYLAGELAGDEQTALEDHLFECGECARVADGLGATADGVRAVVTAGRLVLAATPDLVERLERDGLQVRHNRPLPGAVVPCSVAAEDDYVASHLPGDFTGVDEVEVVAVRADGVEMRRIPGVPVGPHTTEVTVLTRADRIRAMPTMTFRYRVLSGERVIAEYTFSHTAFVP